MILPILQAPDPFLRQVSKPIEVASSVKKLGGDLLDTMRKHKGFGLSAIQVGHPVRMIAINPRCGFPFLVAINPQIVWASPEMEPGNEGCLSIEYGKPRFPKARHHAIAVKFTDRADQDHTVKVHGIAARVLQHEIDHLDGRMIGP